MTKKCDYCGEVFMCPQCGQQMVVTQNSLHEPFAQGLVCLNGDCSLYFEEGMSHECEPYRQFCLTLVKPRVEDLPPREPCPAETPSAPKPKGGIDRWL